LNADGVPGFRPTPDGIHLAALQNHVIAKERAHKREGLEGGRCGKWALRKSAAILPKQKARGSGCEKSVLGFHGFEPPLISQSPGTMRQESMRIHSINLARVQ